VESEGLARMMYNNGEGNTIQHYYAGKGAEKPKKKKKKTAAQRTGSVAVSTIKRNSK